MSVNSPFRTSSDLVLLVLQRTGVLSVGQPVDPEDFNNINNQLDSIFRKVAGLEIVYVSDPANIPGAWFSDLVDIVIGECASTLGLRGQDYIDAVNKGLGGAGGLPVGAGAAVQALKTISRARPTYEPARIVNF